MVEVGAGLGSLTVALAATGADVLAVEVDAVLLPALQEAVAGASNVWVVRTDAMAADCVVIVTDHSQIDYGRVTAQAALVVDTRNALNGDLRRRSSARIIRL